MCTQNHVSGAIDNYTGGVCSAVIKYLIDCLIDALRCGSLLGSNGSKADEELFVHGSSVI